MPAQTTSEDRTDSQTSTGDMLRIAIREALAEQAAAIAAPASAETACCSNHPAPPAPSSAQVREMSATLSRGFKVAPVLTAGGLVLGGLAVLGMVTAALLAVAVTALALAVTAVVLVLLVKMLRKELGR